MTFRIGVDVIPTDIAPYRGNDYAVKSLLGLFYQPIINLETELKSLCTYIRISKFTHELNLKCKRWSNGEKIQVYDIIKTWKFLADSRSEFAKQLDYVEGWKEYRKGKKSFCDVGISYSENTIEIVSKFDIDMSIIFSQIELTPINFNDKTATSGTFSLIQNVPFLFSPNKFVEDALDEELKLCKIYDLAHSKKSYNQNDIDVTPTTLYDHSELQTLDDCVYKKTSNIHIAVCANDLSRNFVYNSVLQSQFEKNIYLPNIDMKTNYFFDSTIFNMCKPIETSKVEKLKVAISDYYPNRQIVSLLFGNECRLNIKTFDYRKLPEISHTGKFDAVLILFFTPPSNSIDLLLSYLNFIPNEKTEEYLNLLNKIDSLKIDLNMKEMINDFLSRYCNLIPVGNLRHEYVSRLKQYEFRINQNDEYLIERV